MPMSPQSANIQVQPGVSTFPQFRHGALVSVSKPIGAISFTIGTVATLRSLFHGLWIRKGLGATLFETFTVFMYQVLLALPAITVIANKTQLTAAACCSSHVLRSWALMTVGLKLTPNAESLRTILHVRIELILEIMLGIQDQLNPFAMAIMHALREVGWMSILYTNMGYSLRHVMIRGTFNWIVLMGFTWFYYERTRSQYSQYLLNMQQRITPWPVAQPVCSSSRTASTSGAGDECNTPHRTAGKQANAERPVNTSKTADWDEWKQWEKTEEKAAGHGSRHDELDNEKLCREQLTSSKALCDKQSLEKSATSTVPQTDQGTADSLWNKSGSKQPQTLPAKNVGKQLPAEIACATGKPLSGMGRQIRIRSTTIQHTRSLPEGWGVGSQPTETATQISDEMPAVTQRSKSMHNVMQLMRNTRHAAYASRYRCETVHMKMRGIEPEQLPSTILTELEKRLAELNPTLKIQGMTIRHGCVIMSMTLTDLAAECGPVISHDRMAETLASALTNIIAELPGGNTLRNGEQLTVQADEHIVTFTWNANSQQYVVQGYKPATIQPRDDLDLSSQPQLTLHETADNHLDSTTYSAQGLSGHSDTSEQLLHAHPMKTVSMILAVEDVVLSVNQESMQANLSATLLLPTQHRLCGWGTIDKAVSDSKVEGPDSADCEVLLLVKLNNHYAPVSINAVEKHRQGEGPGFGLVTIKATVTIQPEELSAGATKATLELWQRAARIPPTNETITAGIVQRSLEIQPSEVLCSSLPMLLVSSRKASAVEELNLFIQTTGGVVASHSISAATSRDKTANDFVSDLGHWLEFVGQTLMCREELSGQTNLSNTVLQDHRFVLKMRDVGYSLLLYTIQQGLLEVADLLVGSFQQVDSTAVGEDSNLKQSSNPQRWFADLAQQAVLSIAAQTEKPESPEFTCLDAATPQTSLHTHTYAANVVEALEEDIYPRLPLLHAAMISGNPDMLALVLSWGKQFGGKDWIWSWQIEDDTGCVPLHVTALNANCAGLLRSIGAGLSDSSLEAARSSWINDQGRVGVTPSQLYVMSRAMQLADSKPATTQVASVPCNPVIITAGATAIASSVSVPEPETTASLLSLDGTQALGRTSNDTDHSSAAEMTCFLTSYMAATDRKSRRSVQGAQVKNESGSSMDIPAFWMPLKACNVKESSSSASSFSAKTSDDLKKGSDLIVSKDQGCSNTAMSFSGLECEEMQYSNKQCLKQQLRMVTACWCFMLLFTLAVRVMQAIERGHVLHDIPALFLHLGGYLPLGLSAAGWVSGFGDWQAWLFPIMLMRASSAILASHGVIPFPMIWHVVLNRHMDKVFVLLATVVEQVPFPLFLVGRCCEAIAMWKAYIYLQMPAPLLTATAVNMACIPIAILAKKWQAQTCSALDVIVRSNKGVATEKKEK